jgi:hypothetical protein
MPAPTRRRSQSLAAVVVVALLLAGCAGKKAATTAAATTATTTATATTVEPTTTTNPPATAAEKAWIAGVVKLRQRIDRILLTSGTVTQASLREGAAAGRSCRPGLDKLGDPGERFAKAVQRAQRACASYAKSADAQARVAPYLNTASSRVDELLNQAIDQAGNGSNGLREAEAMAKEALL